MMQKSTARLGHDFDCSPHDAGRGSMSLPQERHTGASPTPSPASAGAARIPPPIFVVKQMEHVRLVTDRGRKLLLFQFEPMVQIANGPEANGSTESDRRQFLDVGEQVFLRNTKPDLSQVIRVVEPRTECNCHGWIFTGGEYGIYGSQGSAILEDNGYALVQDPKESDLAIYWDRHGVVAHAGIVRTPPWSASLLVESKWGPFGVYLHPPLVHPFSGACSYYRSPRTAHANLIECV